MIVQTTEWEGQQVRLVSLSALPGPAYSRARLPRQVRRVSIHQTSGKRHRGLAGVLDLVSHWTSQPAYTAGPAGPQLAGGGYGRPAPYHFVIPAPTPGPAGKLEVYRLASDQVQHAHSYQPLALAPRDAVTIGVCGHYTSRHGATSQTQPDSLVWLCLEELVRDYLLPRFGLTTSSLTGGWEQGCPADPGDAMEQWIRYQRREAIPDPGTSLASWPSPELVWPADCYRKPLPPERLGAALDTLGYQVGPASTHWTDQLTSAVRAVQVRCGLLATGALDTQTEGAIRRALAPLA